MQPMLLENPHSRPALLQGGVQSLTVAQSACFLRNAGISSISTPDSFIASTAASHCRFVRIEAGPSASFQFMLSILSADARGWTTLKGLGWTRLADRKSTRLNSSHGYISYAVFCLKKKNTK